MPEHQSRTRAVDYLIFGSILMTLTCAVLAIGGTFRDGLNLWTVLKGGLFVTIPSMVIMEVAYRIEVAQTGRSIRKTLQQLEQGIDDPAERRKAFFLLVSAHQNYALLKLPVENERVETLLCALRTELGRDTEDDPDYEIRQYAKMPYRLFQDIMA